MLFHHILSDLDSDFGKGPKGFLKTIFGLFLSREGLMGSTKIWFKYLKFGMGVPQPKYKLLVK